MLLSSMTYKEMYDHLASDLKKVQIREQYFLPKAIREFKKQRKFPAWMWYEYIVPTTRNKYIIYFYAESRAFIEKPIVDNFSIVFDDKNNKYVIQWVAGAYKHTENSPLSLVRQIHVYTSHFFERYNERILNNKYINANDIVCIYLSRNRFEQMTPIKMNNRINKHLEKLGNTATYGYRVRDGFCFTRSLVECVTNNNDDEKVEAICVMYATFMNESDMKESQISAINEEYYNIWQQTSRVFIKEAEDG